MKKRKVKRFFISIASASAVAAINYSLFHSGLVFIVLAVLVAHELGHYITAKINGVDADLPYFIPFPIISIGVTRINNIKHLPKNIAQKIIAYGPITGFITSFYLLLLSLIFPFFPSTPFILMCVSELLFNYFGSDGKKYRQIKQQEQNLCTL